MKKPRWNLGSIKRPGRSGDNRPVAEVIDAISNQLNCLNQSEVLQSEVERMQAILDEFTARHDEIAEAIMDEMGAPWDLAKNSQAASGSQHIKAAIKAMPPAVHTARDIDVRALFRSGWRSRTTPSKR